MTLFIPFFQLNGIELVDREESGVTCVSEVRPWLTGTPELGIQAGVMGLADSVMSYAGADSTTREHMPVTINMHLEFQSPPPPVGAKLTGRAWLESEGGDVSLIRGEVSGDRGTIASGTLRSVLVPIAELPSGPPTSRSPVSVVPPIAMSERWITPSPEGVLGLPAAVAIGLRVVAIQPGSVELSALPGAELERTEGVVHGGAIPMMGSLACEAVLEVERRARVATRLSVLVEYLRPTRIGEPIAIRARLVHRGRRFLALHAEVINADGKPTARIYEAAALPGQQ